MIDNKDTGEVLNSTPFSQQLAFLSRGMLDFEATEALAAVVKAVRDTGKAGTFTIKLKVAMMNQRDENAVKVIPSISTQLPKLAPYESVLFSTADGDLLRDDPKQRKLDLREVQKADRGQLQEVVPRPQLPAAPPASA